MLRDLIGRLERSQPNLARWLGDRLDLQLPAIGASVLTHVLLLIALVLVPYAANRDLGTELQSRVVRPELDDFARIDTTAVADIDMPTSMTPVAGSVGPKLNPLIVQAPTTAAPNQPNNPRLSKVQVALSGRVVLPTVSSLGQSVSIKGNGADHVGDVEGAVDRVAVEVLRRMEQGPTLVVWAFDASGSLLTERQRLAKYIDGVYGHIAEMDSEKFAERGGLLTTVVAFGKERKLLTPEPTADRSTIVSAINDVYHDATGIETTFTTVADIVRKWGRYKRDNETYRTMVIVVTDEVGEDEDRLEDAIATAVAAKVPVYVLGSPALFGRVQGFMNYTDPKTGQTFTDLPVRQGPESVLTEGIRLPFWYDGPQYDFIDAGFGPYALSRLAGATGGIYFVTRMNANRPSFDPAGMREYRPDWVSKSQYQAAVGKHPIRQAVVQASLITQQNNLPGGPSLIFPAAVEGGDFKEAMKRNQEIVARVEYTVRAALEPITAVAKRRDHEPSRRWQAHFDLIRGRLLAMLIRCSEYNSACARMQKDPKKFADPKSNAWRMVPDDEVQGGTKAEGVANEAKALLRRVMDSHPGTPWALLAQRELKDPFGFKWVETYVPPPPPRREVEVAAARKKAMTKKAMVPPAEVPKL